MTGCAGGPGLQPAGADVAFGFRVGLGAGGALQAGVGEVGGLVDVGPVGGVGDDERDIVGAQLRDEARVGEAFVADFRWRGGRE